VVGEVNLDLSLAIMEDRECVIVLQGALGDIDVSIPDDIGVQIEANVVFGQIDFNHEKEAGFMNKRVWQSLNYDESDQKVKLIISYIVGDIDIRIN
jgi:lia operon protein LiaF